MERGYQKLAALIKEVELEIQDRETTFSSMLIQDQESEKGESFLKITEELEYVKYAYESGIELIDIRRRCEGKPKFEPKIHIEEPETNFKMIWEKYGQQK